MGERTRGLSRAVGLIVVSVGFASLLSLASNVRNLLQVGLEQTASISSLVSPAVVVSNANASTVSDDDDDDDEHVFSACLLTMDDTHFLIEWIPYHYHALKLRHLVVAVDPNSKTSPSHVFDRWRNHGMMIEEWSDGDFMGTNITEKHIESSKFSPGMTLHRFRQKRFYQACLRHLGDENRTWTLLVDSDEYLALNTHTMNLSVTVETPGAVLSFLKQEWNKTNSTLQTTPCLMIPRLRYGSRESSMEKVTHEVPSGFNGSSFQTMRFRKHAPYKSGRVNKIGKSIVDVSRFTEKELVVHGPHRPLLQHCGSKSLLYLQVPQSPLVVRHYTGTLEQFSFREDARHEDGIKTSKAFNSFKNLNMDDDGIRPWLKGFVNDVGKDAAAGLLEGVGDVSQGRWIIRKNVTGDNSTIK